MTPTGLVARTERAADRVPPVVLVLAGAGSVQFGAAFATTLFDELGPAGAVMLRLAFAAIILVALWRPSLGGHTRSEIRIAGLFGLVLGAMNLAFYEAIDRIPLGLVVTIEFVGPLGVAVVGSRKALDVLWVVFAATGLVPLGGGVGGDLDRLGLVLALVAGACWAAYILLSARVGAIFPGGSGLAIAMVVGALAVVPLGVSDGGSNLLAPELLAAGLVVAIASSVIPYSFELEALRRLPTNVFGVLMSLDPAIAALAGFIVLGQDLHPAEIAAIALVVIASAGASFGAGGRTPAVVDG
jgi:inner membrane transporter RhtA